MPDTPTANDAVPVSRIFLSLHNPRHEPVQAEVRAIEKLCAKENVYPLARDIVKHGLNPLERFALIPLPATGQIKTPLNYFCAEGNRRMCSLKLLNDPQLAPATLRKMFEKLASDWAPISSVPAVIFKNDDEVRVWLDRIHNGPQGGIGRKDWNSEQKTRFYGGNKNRLAQLVLDYAEKEKMISTQEREGKLTTCQRFVEKDAFQDVLGLDASDPDELGRTRPKQEFDVILKKFMRDLVESKDVTSRMNKPEIRKYGIPLLALPGVTVERIQSEPLSTVQAKTGTKVQSPSPKKPPKVKFVRDSPDIENALEALGNHKLMSLYHSLCTIEIENHTPLLSVGAWSFFETLTSCAGRGENTSFDSYLSKTKIVSYGIKGETTSYAAALRRVREFGNSTKHHSTAASFNGAQLNNDMITLEAIIVKCIEEAEKRP